MMIRRSPIIAVAVCSVMLSACTSASSSQPPSTSSGSSSSGSGSSGSLVADLDTTQVVTPKGEPWKVPAEVRDATGTFTATLDPKTRELSWEMSWSGVGDPSLRVIDIHLGDRGEFGGVLVRLCAPCEPDADEGLVKLKKEQAADLLEKGTWVTLLIDDYPNGVIRGQIEAS